jgi:hypothetical protein
MKESINVWGIKEYEGDGASCPVIPANLPFHKKVVLFFSLWCLPAMYNHEFGIQHCETI